LAPRWNFAENLGVSKVESPGYRIRRCLGHPRFSHICRTPTSDLQTDRQSEGTHDDSIYRASIASSGKNRLRLDRVIATSLVSYVFEHGLYIRNTGVILNREVNNHEIT